MPRPARDEQGNPQPRFEPGERVFFYYNMEWVTVVKPDTYGTQEVMRQGEPTGEFDTWYVVRYDDNRGTDLANDGGTMGWDMSRIVPPNLAARYYPKHPDPKAA